MFKQFFEVFWPKAMEYVAEQGLSNALNIKDFEHTLENLQENLKLLSAKAIDVETEIKNAEDSGRKKRKREVEVWLEGVKSIEKEVYKLGSEAESGGFIMRFLDGGKAAQLNGDIVRLVQQRLDFGEPVLDSRGTREEILLTNGMVGEASNENLEMVLKLLESRQDSKIGVYGMGGVGKTTLAKHVYNRLVQQSQGRVFWITVSQEFTLMSLQKKIARCLGVDLSDEDEEAIRAGRLNRFFTQLKNSVLILDDVWERIDMLKVGCTFSAEGCRLIITTRSLEVCRQIGCKKLISVVKLCKDEAWKLFNETLENEAELGPRVEEIAKSMTMLCGGLPLGIITVAGCMKGETAIHTWQNALAELRECVRGQDEIGEVEEVFKVLKYSFDRLKRNAERQSNEPNMIQHCFLYCSLYPEDYPIPIEYLVREFISDGLLDERRSRRAQVEQGHSIVDKLANLCLLEKCVNNYDEESDYDVECHYAHESVKMHDLVRAMALRICKGKYMMVRGGGYLVFEGNEWSEDLEKVSLIRSGISRIEDGISPNCPKLSTLLLFGIQVNIIPDSFFSKMQGICTLDLGSTSISMLPDSISDMTHLKALNLEHCIKLEKVPYLGKLKALRELNLSYTAIKEAPQGLEELLTLRVLSMMNAWGVKMLPSGVFLKLGHLQHLELPDHLEVSTEEMESMKQLEEFNGGVENVSGFNWFIATPSVHGTCTYRGRVNSKHGLKPHLTISKDLGGENNRMLMFSFDLEEEKVLRQGIVDLSMHDCEGGNKWFVGDLSGRFNNPTSLRTLEILKCGGIEWIMRSEDCQLSSTLEIIKLWELDDLKGVVLVMERGDIPIPMGIGAASAMQPPPVFSSLTWLEIFKCNKMRKVGLQVSRVPNLELITIGSCGEIQEIFEDEVEEEEDDDEGRASASTLTIILPRLRKLRLSNLPRLTRVSNATIISNSIQIISINKCPELMKKLPLHFDDPVPPPSLEEIRVDRGWWESLEWDDPLHPQLLQPFFDSEDE